MIRILIMAEIKAIAAKSLKSSFRYNNLQKQWFYEQIKSF